MSKKAKVIGHVVVDQTGYPVRWPCMDGAEALDIAHLLNDVVKGHGVEAEYRAAIITEREVQS